MLSERLDLPDFWPDDKRPWGVNNRVPACPVSWRLLLLRMLPVPVRLPGGSGKTSGRDRVVEVFAGSFRDFAAFCWFWRVQRWEA